MQPSRPETCQTPEPLLADDQAVSRILASTQTVALIGASDKPARASWQVMQFLQQQGWRVIPVNPLLAGQSVLGETCLASLEELPDTVQMLDIFRASDAVPEIVAELLDLQSRGRLTGVRTLWMQLGVIAPLAATTALAAGLEVVMDRCPKIEWPRLIPAPR